MSYIMGHCNCCDCIWKCQSSSRYSDIGWCLVICLWCIVYHRRRLWGGSLGTSPQ